MRAARAPVLVLALVVLASGPASAQRLVVALSTPEVRIASNFTGIDITLFGAVERRAAPADEGAFDVVTVLRGPSETVVVRRKQRTLGIWINREQRTFPALPSYYAMHATRPIVEFADPDVLDRFQIGLDHLAFQPESGSPAISEAAARDFRTAVIRLRGEEGLFVDRPSAVRLVGTSIFQTAFHLPATVPVGHYRAIVFLFRDGRLVDRAETALSVNKTGFEQFMAVAARDRALLYGLACIALALLTGWLAGVIFRRD